MVVFDVETKEGIPLREYRWVQLGLAFFPGFLMHSICTAIGWTLKEKIEGEITNGGRAPIIVVFHREFPITVTAPHSWNKLFHGIGYLGVHNWISYCTSVLCYLDGLKAVRYDRRSGKKPLFQVVDFLNQNALVPFAIRTDSGGPYERVRTSVVKMAIQANRPIVCIRQSADRSWRFWDHFFPKPFASVITRVSAPISAQTLRPLSVEEATAQIQLVMDSLG